MKSLYTLIMAVLLLSLSSFVHAQADNMQTAELQKTGSAPIIDGDISEWADVGFYQILNICTGDVSKSLTSTSGYWQGLWDDDYLYIHVSVVDDEYATDDDLRDILEIYVDMNNNKAEGSTDPEEPFANGPRFGPGTQYAWQWADPTLEFTDPELFAEGGLGEGSDTLVVWARTNKANNLGYELEVAFPWNSLQTGYVPAVGNKISWDVDIADINPGDEVKTDQYWSNDGTGAADPSGEARPCLWYSMAMSGDIELGEGPDAVFVPSQSEINFYPNPVDNYLNINNVDGLSKVEVFNICGQMMKSVNFSGTSKSEIDFSTFNNGVYILKLYSKESYLSSVRIVKQ